MKHIVITVNEPASIVAMDSYSGALLVHDDMDFLSWYCTDLAQEDIDKITGNGVAQEVRLVGMLLLNKPMEEVPVLTIGAMPESMPAWRV